MLLLHFNPNNNLQQNALKSLIKKNSNALKHLYQLLRQLARKTHFPAFDRRLGCLVTPVFSKRVKYNPILVGFQLVSRAALLSISQPSSDRAISLNKCSIKSIADENFSFAGVHTIACLLSWTLFFNTFLTNSFVRSSASTAARTFWWAILTLYWQ